jgi:phosphohistidine phosphatase
MKNLLIMRHAKSDWNNSSLTDFDRPLNERGAKIAPLIGKELLHRKKIPELIISSPANRAKATAQMVAESCIYEGEIIFEKDFYLGSLGEIIEIIRKKAKDHSCIMVVGHNPTWETLVSKLCKSSTNIQMPTAAVASIFFDMDAWTQLSPGTGKLEFLLIPKDLKA